MDRAVSKNYQHSPVVNLGMVGKKDLCGYCVAKGKEEPRTDILLPEK
jgi:hypothetical protein